MAQHRTLGRAHGTRAVSGQIPASPSPYGDSTTPQQASRRKATAFKLPSSNAKSRCVQIEASCDGQLGAILLPSAEPSKDQKRPSTSDILAAAQIDDANTCSPVAPISGAESNLHAQMYERKLQEQNQRFWETANRMDKALSDEESRCVVLVQELSEVEANSAESGARAESRICVAESKLSITYAEIEDLRKTTRERVCRHASDMEALNDKLCKAHLRCTESETLLEETQSRIEVLHRELQEEVDKNQLNAGKMEAVLDLERRLNEEVAMNDKLHEERALYRLCESRLLEEHSEQKHEHEALYSACEFRVSEQNVELEGARHEFKSFREMHLHEMSATTKEMSDVRDMEAFEKRHRLSEETEVIRLREECSGIEGLRQDAAEVVAARANERKLTAELEDSRRLFAVAEQALQVLRVENAEGAEQLSECKETSRKSDLEQRSEARVADAAILEAQEARQEAARAKERYENEVRRSCLLENELEMTRKSEDEHRSFWVSTHRISIRAEEQTIEEERQLSRERLATEESNMRKSISAMEQSAGEFREQFESEFRQAQHLLVEATENNTLLLASEHHMTVASGQLAELESALATEYDSCSSMRNQFDAHLDHTRTCFQAELYAAAHSKNKTKEEQEREIVALRAEVEECTELQRQVCLGRERNLKLQEAAEALRIEDQELTIELAQARALAKKHGQAATEYRADLVATKRELAKQQHAERDLKQAVEEVETLSAKFTRAQRGREVAEHEVKQEKNRLVALERQVRELQTRLAAEQFGRQNREPSMYRNGSVDAMVSTAQQSHHSIPSPSNAGRENSPQSAALSLRRNRSADIRAESAMCGTSATHAPGINPRPASPGMSRSHSLGEFVSNMTELDNKGDVQVQAQTTWLSHDGMSRTVSSQPPRPPQVAAPRMGWATHARNREVNNERQGDLLYSPGTSSSSIDRVIR